MHFEHMKQISIHEMMDLKRIPRQKSLSKKGSSIFHSAFQSKPLCYRRMKNVLLIQPHHLSQLAYLHLSEMWYIHSSGNMFLELSDNQIRNFVVWDLQEYVKEKMHRYFCNTFFDANHPLPLKFLRSFLGYYRIAGLQEITTFPAISFICVLSHMQCFYNDESPIAEVLTTICSTRKMKNFILNPWIPKELVSYILRMCNKARFDVREFFISGNDSDQISMTSFCPVLHCLFGGKIKVLKILLQHGFELRGFHLGIRILKYQKYLPEMDALVLFRPPLNSFIHSSFKRNFLILDTFCLVAERSLHWTNQLEDWDKCASLLFRNIPDPLITLGELVNMLSNCNSSIDLLSSVCSTFLNDFTEIRALEYKPRTLQHLSRCTIRKCLSNNFELPHGIYALPLPRMFLQYLLLEY